MPALEGMHSPGSETAHLLPPAGIKQSVGDVFRFHRVTPFYPPDPCIRPNEADLVCPPEDLGPKHHSNMLPAGVNMQSVSDRFAFHKARAGSSKRPCPPEGRQFQVEQPCPCTNSSGYPPRMRDDIAGLRYASPLTNTSCGPLEAKSVESCLNDPCKQSNEWPMPRDLGGSTQFSNVPVQFEPTVNSKQAVGIHPYQSPSALQQKQAGQYVSTGGMSALNKPLSEYNTTWCNQLHPGYANPYYTHPYVCRPVYHTKYLEDCPHQDGPPADSYTFL